MKHVWSSVYLLKLKIEISLTLKYQKKKNKTSCLLLHNVASPPWHWEAFAQLVWVDELKIEGLESLKGNQEQIFRIIKRDEKNYLLSNLTRRKMFHHHKAGGT